MATHATVGSVVAVLANEVDVITVVGNGPPAGSDHGVAQSLPGSVASTRTVATSPSPWLSVTRAASR